MERGRFQSQNRVEVAYVPDPDIGFRVGATFMKHEFPWMLKDKCFEPGTILFNHGRGRYETVHPFTAKKTGKITKHVTVETSSQELAKAGIL